MTDLALLAIWELTAGGIVTAWLNLSTIKKLRAEIDRLQAANCRLKAEAYQSRTDVR